MFFVIWGTKRTETVLGYVVDQCAVCHRATRQAHIAAGSVGHIYGISLGKGKVVGHVRRCVECKAVAQSTSAAYPAVGTEDEDFATLVLRSNPWLAARLEDRARILEETLDSDPLVAQRAKVMLLALDLEGAGRVEQSTGLRDALMRWDRMSEDERLKRIADATESLAAAERVRIMGSMVQTMIETIPEPPLLGAIAAVTLMLIGGMLISEHYYVSGVVSALLGPPIAIHWWKNRHSDFHAWMRTHVIPGMESRALGPEQILKTVRALKAHATTYKGKQLADSVSQLERAFDELGVAR